MNFWQAALYFLREAIVSLVRSWKISMIAVLTIALSLFLGGLVVLTSQALARTILGWGEELKLVVYLEQDVSEDEIAAVAQSLEEPAWTLELERVESAQAQERFQENFPSLGSLIEEGPTSVGGEDSGLLFPSSLEIGLDSVRIEEQRFSSWLGEIEQLPGVEMVDDDRDFLNQLGNLLSAVRTFGLVLGGALLAAAIFTIASVVRLTAYLYLDEIAVMRMVGATEFYIRGPFYFEGMLQGLLGGVLALLGLHGSARLLAAQEGLSMWGLPSGLLPPSSQAALVLLGGLAGLLGAVISLRRERLQGATADAA